VPHDVGADRDRAGGVPTTDVPCTYGGCGLPDRLHGAPDQSRVTHSDHWYCASSENHAYHRHGPEARAGAASTEATPPIGKTHDEARATRMQNPHYEHWRFFTDHPLPWELSDTSAGFTVEDANHEVLWRFDHYDRADVERFVASLNDVVSVEEAPYIRGYNRGWDDALEELAPAAKRLLDYIDGSGDLDASTEATPPRRHLYDDDHCWCSPEATERPDLRPSVAAFAALMERVLRDNDHKGGWQDCEPEWLLMRLRQEVAELDEAMQKGTIARRDESGRTSDWPADIAREAADVANFAMMIADVRGALTGATSPSEPPEHNHGSFGCDEHCPNFDWEPPEPSPERE
jgi:NTP pyrophosphatase (non-canonical NTP hydrolase)